jgi:hypothetical protein
MKKLIFIGLIILCAYKLSISSNYSNNTILSDTIKFTDNSTLVNSWLTSLHITCRSNAYNTSVPANGIVYFLTGYGTGTNLACYKNKTASPIVISSSTNYTLTASWTVVTPTKTKDMFVAKYSYSDLLNILNIDTLLLPSQTLNAVDINYFDGAQYTYLWSTGETTASINITNPGWYKVTVTKDLNNFTHTHNFGIGPNYRHYEGKDSIEVESINVPIRVNATILIKDGSLMIYKTYVGKK